VVITTSLISFVSTRDNWRCCSSQPELTVAMTVPHQNTFAQTYDKHMSLSSILKAVLMFQYQMQYPLFMQWRTTFH